MNDDPAKAKRQAMMVARGVVSPDERQENLSAFQKGNHPMVPLVAYHATGGDFSAFDPQSMAKAKLGNGIYLTPSKQKANVFAKIRASQGHAANIMPVHPSIKNPYLIHGEDNIPASGVDTEKLKRNGFDGIILHGDDGSAKEIVAFHPTQIKSAIGNQGTFDPNDPDITKARGGMIDDNDKAIRRATMVAKGLAKEIGPLPTGDRQKPPHPASMIPGVHVTGMGDGHTAIPDGYADGGDVEPTDETGFDAYHGSPHAFNEFNPYYIGTGEGAQMYGHGMYFATNKNVAEDYRNKLSKNLNEIHFPYGDKDEFGLPIRYTPEHFSFHEPEALAARAILDSNISKEQLKRIKEENASREDMAKAMRMIRNEEIEVSRPGYTYHVRVHANPEHFLDWDKPLSEQHPHVQQALSFLGLNPQDEGHPSRPGEAAYRAAVFQHGKDPAKASAALLAAGIPGIRYLDADSRDPNTGNPTHNHVVFDPSKITIKRRYARGGVVGHYAGGGYTSPDDTAVQEALKRVASPFSENPEHVQEALRIASTFQIPMGNKGLKQPGGYYNIKQPVGVSDVKPTVAPLGNVSMVPKKNISWEDLYNQGKGGSFINMGGDRSNLGRLTHINDKPLAWPVDLHAGPKYMREPNPGAVWANNITHGSAFKNAIRRAAENGPVYGMYAPMGPKSVDSSHNMFDAVMAQIPGSNISKEDADKFDKDVKNASFLPASEKEKKEYVQELMSKWPGVLNAKEASEFARTIPGLHRANIIKHMDKATWLNAGFPAIGMTRAAITDPEVLNAPGNMLGHRVVKFDPNNLEGIEEAFSHSTYTDPTGGKYVGDLPLVQRHYAAPEVIEKLLKKPTKSGDVVHPYSMSSIGRSTARKMFEEQKQIQPINQRMLDSVLLGLQRQKDYGFSSGGVVERALKLARQQTPVPAAAKKKSGT